ncbi:MAG: DUF4019 domain-containing protein [Comamonadaceae bacterium]|nr:MAG: DUF4019 domain-containing protein [Comamonadaceae bacterium]
MTVSRSRTLCTIALCTLSLSGASAFAQLKAPKEATPTGVAPPNRARPAASAPAPSAAAEKEEAGKLAAAGWLTLLDRRDWGTAWETSAGMFRSTVPLGSWMDNIPKVRAPLGTLVERAPNNSQYTTALEGRPAGDYVSVIFVSKFEKQELQEIVTTVREPDGKWRVTGYSTR